MQAALSSFLSSRTNTMAFRALGRAPTPCNCAASAYRAPIAPRPPQSLSQHMFRTPAVAEGRSAASVADLKRTIIEQAGERSGLDRTEEQKQAVVKVVESLEQAGSVKDVDYTGTTWRLVFSTSTSESAGKLGPFTGRVRQEFPADLPGQYLNKVDFGLVKAKLLGNYKRTGQRVNLVFLWTEFSCGPFKFKKDFPDGFKGHWNLKYVDDDMRVFSTNKGNVFVLAKADEGRV